MTERLYYADPYLTKFEATVLEARGSDVRLDRSAFYPTSGGQPFDTGDLGGLPVKNVFVDGNGEVWHSVDGALAAGQRVSGEIDWARRFDHMQQHAGEHMLAGASWRLYGGHTIGLHLGRDDASIDMDLPGGATRLSDAQLEALENDVNARIQRDVPIRCWFPSATELSRLPLRKAPAVAEHVRVVAIGEDEYCACGGTHPASAGQIGLVKITDARPSKGKLRLTFVCGARAYRFLRTCFSLSDEAARRLSTARENLPEAVSRIQEQLREAERALSALRRERALVGLPDMLGRAEALPGGGRLVAAALAGDMSTLRDVAAALTREENLVALLAAQGEEGRVNCVFARSADARADMGALMKEAARRLGAKGGGRPDFAQGSGTGDMLATAKALLISTLC